MTALSFSNAAIVGMGQTGCSVARFLGRYGIACTAFDEGTVELPDDLKHIPLHTGALNSAKLAKAECIIVSPGIPWHHPVLQKVRQNGMRVVGDLDLFLEQFNGEILAVTGTNGKTTAISLIAVLLETQPGGIEAAGNIGQPMLDLLEEEHLPDRVALELSSFQLERCAGIRPGWAALLNVQPDHADMHLDAASYLAAKLKIFEQQGEGDTALLPDAACWHELAGELAARGVHVRRFGVTETAHGLDAGLHISAGKTALFWSQDGDHHIIDCDEILVRGSHQQLNMAVAAQAAADFGVHATVIREALTSFRGLPHRLQHLGSHAGHEWFNDSKATNPDAARAALESFGKVLWICGGLRKGLDLSPLNQAISRHVSHAYIIGKNTEAFAALLKSAGVSFDNAGDVQQAVEQAAGFAEPLPVLLSPAAASQDQFANYAERGRTFAEAVDTLEEAA